ncbi:hypothetical protein [Nostoc sp. LPT]|uniref:hypothetical protein n=1 Tax=Nostoc sp. LPT TaxID=2815387 RepID=UPI001DBA39E7|nr:hypothetical protein [Nostoc sp. LPT]MBN4007042.1 hypothetical protein [Nostoc sp. LPT]
MSLVEFQRVLLKIYTSPSFRTTLRMDLNKSLQGYELSEIEVSALTQLAVTQESNQLQLEEFNDYLLNKKIYGLWDGFRTVSTFFDCLKEEVITSIKYCYDFKSRSDIQTFDYFANLLYKFSDKSEDPVLKCFKEVVRYDLIACKAPLLALQYQKYDEIKMQIASNPANLIGNIDSLLVTKSPSVFIEEFSYNIPALYKGININELQTEPSIFAFILLDIQLVNVCHLSPAIQFLLNKAESPISIENLVREAAFFHNLTNIPENFKQIYVELIQKLCKQGILVESWN